MDVRRALLVRVLAPASLALSSITVTAACGDSPQVTLSTRVGEPAVEDPSVAFESVGSVLEALWEARHPTPVSAAQGQGPGVVVNPPASPAEFARLVGTLRDGPLEEIAAPARNLAETEASNWILVKAALLADRARSKGEYRSVLAVIGGDVPNRYGHFALHWKKAHGHQVKVSEDWFEDLLVMPLAKVSSAMHDVYRDCVLEAALLRAAAKIGRENPALTRDVVATLLDAAYTHRGTFRDEVGRAIASMGDEAVPHLLRESIPPLVRSKRDEESTPYKRALYAEYSLDRMGRLHPQSAIASVRDQPRLLVSLFRAYELAKTGAAAESLLDFVDAPTPQVRAAARDAFMAYVTGPMPTIRKKTLRLLGGGTTTKSAHVSYRGLAWAAIRDRLERERPEILEQECDLYTEAGDVDPYCEAQPERLARAYIGWLDARRRAEQEQVIAAALSDADTEAAIEHIDRLLAAGADIERPHRLLPLFEGAAETAGDEGRPARAAQLLRKSAMLVASTDAAAADHLRARALLHEASLPDLDPQGRNMLLGTARDLIGDDSELSAALRELHSQRSFDADEDVDGRLRQGLALLLVILTCMGLAGAVLRRRLYGPRV